MAKKIDKYNFLIVNIMKFIQYSSSNYYRYKCKCIIIDQPINIMAGKVDLSISDSVPIVSLKTSLIHVIYI